MRDGGNIIVTCSVCGCKFDALYFDMGCPVCRARRVAKTFAPVDVLRTAMGIGGVHLHGKLAEMQVEQPEGDPDDPKYRLPIGEDNQVYTLKRWFRL
jgi:hypothetical protein